MTSTIATMPSAATHALAWSIAVTSMGCSSYNPYQIPKKEFHDTITRIAVAPTEIDIAAGIPASKSLPFDALIKGALEHAGFTAIPAPDFTDSVFGHITDQGGVFDPVTGVVSEQKLEAGFVHAVEELSRSQSVDAILLPRVSVVEARVVNGMAHWLGTSQSLGESLADDFMLQDVQGTTKALALVIVIVNPRGETLYRCMGGIQTLNVMHGSAFSPHTSSPVPVHELLADPERNEEAVEITLHYLWEPVSD